MTVDGSVGSEANHVIADLVIDGETRYETGFLKDNRRVCVLETRAKISLWQVMSENTGDRYPTPEIPNSKGFRLDSNDRQRKGRGNAITFFFNYYAQNNLVRYVKNRDTFNFLDAPRDLRMEIENQALARFESRRDAWLSLNPPTGQSKS